MGRRIIIVCMFGLLAACLPACSPLMSGDMKFQKGDYVGAEADFKAYLQENPDSFQAQYMLGRTYLSSKALDKALAAFKAALLVKPDNPDATIYLGLTYVAQGDTGKAIHTLASVTDTSRPKVAKAVQQQLTILKVAQSKKMAQKALADENRLATVKPDRDTYAVCYFQDKTPDKRLGPFSKALASMTISNLSQVRSIQVVERVRLQALLEEMALGQTGIIDPATAPRAGRLLGAENLIVGALSQDIRTDTVLASTSRQAMVGSAVMTVDRDNFFELPGAIAANIVKIKNIPLTAEERKAIGYTHTRSIDAAIYYGRALDAMDASDWEAAMSFFDKALKADPAFRLAQIGRNRVPTGVNITSMMTMSPLQMQQSMTRSITSTATQPRIAPVTPMHSQ